jgi:hypothetical protein
MGNTVTAKDQGSHCRAAEIQRFAENAPRRPDLKSRTAFLNMSVEPLALWYPVGST